VCKGKRQTTTSETGGWCDSAARKSYKTDTRLAGALAELFSGRTVVGFGERHGEYRKLILQAGTVKLYDAYDGAPNINYITGGKVFVYSLSFIQTSVLQPFAFCGSWSPSNSMLPGPMPTSVPSDILICPLVWLPYNNAADRTDRTGRKMVS